MLYWVKIRVLKKKNSKFGFVTVFGTFIDACLSKNEVIFGFGKVFKMFKMFKTNSEKIAKISKTPEIGSRFVRVKC